jgi:glycosyltransferase involved in cell wall biosynthesis
VSPELRDLDLLDPWDGRRLTPRDRTVVRLGGSPLGLLRERPAGPLEDPAPSARALSELWDQVAVGLAARRLTAVDEGAETLAASAVVCTRDRAGSLDACLAALAEQSHPTYEVVVVDNASRDDTTRRVAHGWSARYVREPQPGLDWARNRGLAVSRAPIVAFTDDDARPEPEWLAALVRGFGSPDVAAVTGLVLPAELETAAQLAFEDVYGGMGKGYRLRLHAQQSRRPTYRPEWVGVGCNMAFRRAALLELGGFDPALDVGTATGGGGDLDAFQRLLEAGAVIAYRPDAVVRHIHRREGTALRRQLFDNGRAYSAMLTAAFLRAHGLDRSRVASRYLRWLARWHAARLARALAGRERLPLRLVAAEAAGAPLGPVLYLGARRTARRRAAAERPGAT